MRELDEVIARTMTASRAPTPFTDGDWRDRFRRSRAVATNRLLRSGRTVRKRRLDSVSRDRADS